MTLEQQLACVEREIEALSDEHERPWWTLMKQETKDQTDHDLACMIAIAETLRGLMEIGDIRLPGTRPDRGISPTVIWPGEAWGEPE